MSGPLRSKQGCWTCRLRKKKCDELQPECNTCASLAITCYGFGPKPAWMHNAEERQAILHHLREIVKQTSRRKPAVKLLRQSPRIIRPAQTSPSDSAQSSSAPPPSAGHDDDQMLNSDQVPLHAAHSGPSLGTSGDSPSDMGSTRFPMGEESVLFMYFLDHVFPSEYPVYQPSVSEGGRGWLLSMLLHVKQLYHAALALSAHHRRAIGAAYISVKSKDACLKQQEDHLEACMKLIHQSSRGGCSGNKIGNVAAIIQLLFFEVYINPGSMWKAHLDVLVGMYDDQFAKGLMDLGFSESARLSLLEGHSLPEDTVDVELVTVFRFLGGTVLWLDIIASITTGRAPHLSSYHSSALAAQSPTRLEDIMGCKNYIILHIGRIAEVHVQKNQRPQRGGFNSAGFEQAADDVSLDLFANEGLECLEISGAGGLMATNVKVDASTLVTFMFVRMSSVYLHLVSHGFQNLELLDAQVTAAMKTIQSDLSSEILQAIVCPIYVIGTVVGLEDQHIFRRLLSSPPILNPSMQHRQRILPILEQIWRKRCLNPNLSWSECIDLTSDILLI